MAFGNFNIDFMGDANTQVARAVTKMANRLNLVLAYNTLPLQFAEVETLGKGVKGSEWYTLIDEPTMQERDGSTDITANIQNLGKIEVEINRFPSASFYIRDDEDRWDNIDKYTPFLNNHVNVFKKFICEAMMQRVLLAGNTFSGTGSNGELTFNDLLDIEEEMGNARVDESQRYAVFSTWQKNMFAKAGYTKNLFIPEYNSAILENAKIGKMATYETFASTYVYTVTSGLSNNVKTYHNPIFQGKPFYIISKDMGSSNPKPGLLTAFIDIGGISVRIIAEAEMDKKLGPITTFTLDAELGFTLRDPRFVWDCTSVKTV